MHPSEFQRVLNQGLGRAILHLQQQDAVLYQDAILDACLHCTAYDPQVEGTRAQYLHEVIQLTGNYGYYRDHILAAFDQANPSEDWDYLQLMYLILNIADHGYQPARDALYARLKRDIEANFTDIAFALLSLDGLSALTFIAQNYDVNWDYRLLALEIEEFPLDAIKAATQSNLLFQAELLSNLDEIKNAQPIDRNRFQEERSQKFKISYDQLKQSIANGTELGYFGKFGFLKAWGQYASDDELRLAAQDLLAEENIERLPEYITIFYKRPFPLDPAKLIHIVRNRDKLTPDDDRRSIVNALMHLQHPEVRKLALDLLKGGKAHWGVELLQKNFEDGDWSSINQAVTTPDLSPEVFHGLGMDVEDLAFEHPSPEAATALITLYELTPCSHCRARIVKALHTLNLLPDDILHECKFDSNYDLRKLVQNGFVEIDDN